MIPSVQPAPAQPSSQVRLPPRWIRLLFVVVGILAWHWTQQLIGARPSAGGGVGDGLHQLTASINQFLQDNPRWANGLVIVGSFFIDLLGIFLLVWSVVGPSIRPFVGLLLLFGLRQICQALCTLPPPPGMIWEDPGLPSLLVTYGVANDLFFSGHTALAVYGAVELSRLGKRWLNGVAAAVAVYEVITVLLLRAHYTMDVFSGIIAALYVAGIAAQLAPTCDRWLARALAFK